MRRRPSKAIKEVLTTSSSSGCGLMSSAMKSDMDAKTALCTRMDAYGPLAKGAFGLLGFAGGAHRRTTSAKDFEAKEADKSEAKWDK